LTNSFEIVILKLHNHPRFLSRRDRWRVSPSASGLFYFWGLVEKK